jgi:hypothetical protein
MGLDTAIRAIEISNAARSPGVAPPAGSPPSFEAFKCKRYKTSWYFLAALGKKL